MTLQAKENRTGVPARPDARQIGAMFLVSLLICAVGVSITIAAVCLSHLVKKAADLQEQSDLTV